MTGLQEWADSDDKENRHGLEARSGHRPRGGRGARSRVLRRHPWLQDGQRLPPERSVPCDPGDSAGVGLLHRVRHRARRRRGTRLAQGRPPRRRRHRGRPCLPGGEGCGQRRADALRRRRADARRGPGARRLRHLRVLRRPRRELLGDPGGQAPRSMTSPMSDLEAALARHRRELHVHCYRMLASYDEAEDAVQETYLRAWRARDDFDGRHVRAWLYRIATHVCLDRARARQRRVGAGTEVSWLTPYPDPVLDEVASSDDGPDQVYVARETIELAFLTALQVLPPRQRAALLAREVLGLPAVETARLLETSVAAANSALQRARETMREHLPSHRGDWSASEPSAEEKRLLDSFIDAHERCDAEAAMAVAATDLRVTMPPYPWLYDGLVAVRPLLERAFGPDREGDWRLLPTGVNRMPAAASYLRRAGDTAYRGLKLDVLRVEGGEIAEITTFGPELFGVLGLPSELPGGRVRPRGRLRRRPSTGP